MEGYFHHRFSSMILVYFGIVGCFYLQPFQLVTLPARYSVFRLSWQITNPSLIVSFAQDPVPSKFFEGSGGIDLI